MSKMFSSYSFVFVRNIVISFFLIFFVIFSMGVLSDEFNQSQQEFSNSIEAYNQIRAQKIIEREKAEEIQNIEVAQRLSDDENGDSGREDRTIREKIAKRNTGATRA